MTLTELIRKLEEIDNNCMDTDPECHILCDGVEVFFKNIRLIRNFSSISEDNVAEVFVCLTNKHPLQKEYVNEK